MSVNKEPMQRLSKKQEGHLREWIITQEDLGVPPTHKELTNFVEQILINQGDHQPLGKNWVKGVLHRNPEIKTTKGKAFISFALSFTCRILSERSEGVLGASQRSSQTDRPSTTTATTVTAQRRKTRDMKKASARWPAVWKCIENDDRPDAAAWRAILEYNNQVCLDYEAEE